MRTNNVTNSPSGYFIVFMREQSDTLCLIGVAKWVMGRKNFQEFQITDFIEVSKRSRSMGEWGD